MKRFFLSIIAIPFFVFSQNNCDSAITIQSNNTFTVNAFSGTTPSPCFGILAENNTALQTYWYKYTAVQSGLVTINSNLPNNESPNSENTRLSILTGSCDALECYDSADDVNAANQNFLTTLTFPVQAGVTYYIVWDSFYENNSFEFEFTFTAQTCTAVFYIDAPNNTSNTGTTLTWEPSVSQPPFYTIQYGLQGFTLGTGISVSTSQPQITLSSLEAGGTFDYYLKADCGSGQNSDWAGPFRFTLTKTLPYNSGFDTTQEVGGWTQINTSPNFSLVTNAANALSAPSYYLMNALIGQTNDYWLISPGIALTSDVNYLVTINLRTSSATANRNITLSLGTSVDTATHTQIIAAETALNSNPNYSSFSYTFTAPESGVFYIGFRDTSVGVINNSLRIDNFQVSTNLSANSFSQELIAIYPNPAAEQLFIKNNSSVDINEIELLDFQGKHIRTLQTGLENHSGFNISDLPSGLYLVKVSTEKTKLIKKFVKK